MSPGRTLDATPARGSARTAAMVAIATALVFLILEGASSVAFSCYILFFRQAEFMAEEQTHGEYDALLGWINRPALHLPDLYGHGGVFTTNHQRFRADHDYAPEPPRGVRRIVCSGDSFTMGHSVADDQAWCSLLATTMPGVETVNMGMAAYGIDQAFLWYRRDAAALGHDLQLLAFITPDFDRMALDTFGGYPKPYLRVDGGTLQVENVPVPRVFDGVLRRRRQREAATNLALVRNGLAVLERLGIQTAAAEQRKLTDAQVRDVTARIFEDLRDMNRAKGSRLVLVYLPRTGDTRSLESDPWRTFVAREAARLGVEFIDLVEAFRALPLDDGERLFVMPYQPSHYNARGNAWVAEQLRTRLVFEQAAR